MEEKTEIEIKTVKLADLTPTEKNPRKISKDDLEKLKRSVSDFPEMLDVREIVVDENLRILGGHQRVRALKENGVTEATVKIVKNWTDEQKDRFVIQDNLQNGEWDLDTLSSEWDLEKLENWGLEMPENDKFLEPDDYTEEIESDASKFMIASVTALGQTEDIVLVDTIPEELVATIQQKAHEKGGKAVIEKITEALNDL